MQLIEVPMRLNLMTKELFRKDGYLKNCNARVVAHFQNGFATDQTVFYPLGGGQPGDTGAAQGADGVTFEIIDTIKNKAGGQIVHCVAEGAALPEIGADITLTIDWERRYRLMRMHSCMHMLCAALPAPVTGGSIRDGSGRLDFDLPDPPRREDLEERLNELIQGAHEMTMRWISDAEMDVSPELVKTMSVAPPRGAGKVRLVQFGEADLQACGGTHVANSAEIGHVRVASIKNKGRQNRRITIVFAG